MLAIVVNHINNSYFSHCLLKNLKETNDFCIFYSSLELTSFDVNAPLFNIDHIYNFKGKVICCDKNLLPICKHAPLITDVYYYVWNLDWMHDENKKYKAMREIYQNTKLIARSVEQGKIIEDTWNNKPIIIEDFDYEKLTSI